MIIEFFSDSYKNSLLGLHMISFSHKEAYT